MNDLIRLFTLPAAVERDAAIDAWLSSDPVELFSIARRWFEYARDCGDDVTEIIHDGCPVACIRSAAFVYVNVFARHVNIGFFSGAMLNDPKQLLEGTGKHMRHVKIEPGSSIDSAALKQLIQQAYSDVKTELAQQ